MHLHIAGYFVAFVAAEAQARAREIRAAEKIPFPGMQDAQAPAVAQHRARTIKIPAQPDLLQQFLRKRKRAVKTLHFGNDGIGGGAHLRAMLPDRCGADKRRVYRATAQGASQFLDPLRRDAHPRPPIGADGATPSRN